MDGHLLGRRPEAPPHGEGVLVEEALRGDGDVAPASLVDASRPVEQMQDLGGTRGLHCHFTVSR